MERKAIIEATTSWSLSVVNTLFVGRKHKHNSHKTQKQHKIINAHMYAYIDNDRSIPTTDALYS